MSLIISIFLSFVSLAGEWKQDDKGWWYEKDNGNYIINDWFKDPHNGYTYHFDTFGYMNKGVSYLDGKWYHFNEDNGYLMFNYAPSDSMISTDDGTMVTADTPGVTISTIAVYSEDKCMVMLVIKNTRNIPITVNPSCEISDKDFTAKVYLWNSDTGKYCVDMVLGPKENKIIGFAQPDLHPLNMKSGETTARFHFTCENETYWLEKTIWSNEDFIDKEFYTHID